MSSIDERISAADNHAKSLQVKATRLRRELEAISLRLRYEKQHIGLVGRLRSWVLFWPQHERARPTATHGTATARSPHRAYQAANDGTLR